MATHDYSLADQSGASFRGDLNNALSAIASNNSSSTDPATTFAHQFYYDTGDTTFKIRNAANSAYINVSAVGGAETANFGLALAGIAVVYRNCHVCGQHPDVRHWNA